VIEPVILFRRNREIQDEIQPASAHFRTLFNRTRCKDQLVIGRYSVLPHYQEVVEDLLFNNCRLINSYQQHRWIANFEYYQELKHLTPTSWTADEIVLSDYPGPFVVKGRTNSRKMQWSTHMFAENRYKAFCIANELLTDPIISEQDIIYRQYVPLKTYEVGIGGVPFANEWRLFYLGEKRLSYGYYWSIADDITTPEISQEGLDLADAVAKIAAQHVNFFVVDVAEKGGGGWIMIELNDGQMSGLSENNPEELYANLARELLLFRGV
jgi:hypothetical protein